MLNTYRSKAQTGLNTLKNMPRQKKAEGNRSHKTESFVTVYSQNFNRVNFVPLGERMKTRLNTARTSENDHIKIQRLVSAITYGFTKEVDNLF